MLVIGGENQTFGRDKVLERVGLPIVSWEVQIAGAIELIRNTKVKYIRY